MKPLYVFDLDGTLADLYHRLPLIKQERPQWQAFFEACDKDAPIDWVIHLNQCIARAARPEGRILILTGRSETVRGKTTRWLAEYQVEYDKLIMRPAKDYRSDEVLKLELLRNYLKANPDYSVRFVVDDRQKVVDMWRREGFHVLQCDAWQEREFVDMHAPEHNEK